MVQKEQENCRWRNTRPHGAITSVFQYFESDHYIWPNGKICSPPPKLFVPPHYFDHWITFISSHQSDTDTYRWTWWQQLWKNHFLFSTVFVFEQNYRAFIWKTYFNKAFRGKKYVWGFFCGSSSAAGSEKKHTIGICVGFHMIACVVSMK